MQLDWIKVYTTSKSINAAMARTFLEEHDIVVIELNKQDSSYQAFGEIELYVNEEHFAEAITLLSTFEN